MRILQNVGLALVSLVCFSCMRIPKLEKINSSKLTEDQKKTLASITQVSTFPFLSMEYFGDADTNHLKVIREVSGIKTNACSTFTSYNYNNEQLLSRNHDWPESPVLILFAHQKTKYASVSLVDLSMLGYTKRSRYTSLDECTSLLYSIYIPMDGMNEKGLAIGAMGCMGLDSKNTYPVALSTEIIRLVLDNAANVNEAIEIFRKHSIRNIVIPLHYVVSDSTGNSAIIEYINGKVEVQELNGDGKALTNFKYYGSRDDVWKKTNEYLTSGKISKDVFGDSYLRYIKIRMKQITSNGRIDEIESMKLLKEVSMKKKTIYGDFYTVWSVVYNLSSKAINVSIGRDYTKLYKFNLDH